MPFTFVRVTKQDLGIEQRLYRRRAGEGVDGAEATYILVSSIYPPDGAPWPWPQTVEIMIFRADADGRIARGTAELAAYRNLRDFDEALRRLEATP